MLIRYLKPHFMCLTIQNEKVCFVWSLALVICPYPDVDPDRNSSILLYSASENSTGHVFDLWWSKTNTIPFYLIVLLLPLLNFRSASFFARFTFLGMTFIL